MSGNESVSTDTPPGNQVCSVRTEEETLIAGSRGRTSIDFHLVCWCGALVLWLRRNFDFVSALHSVSSALSSILQNLCKFTSLEAKNCCVEFETGRPRDSCYDFVMHIYNQSLSKRTFLRLEVVSTLLYASISSYEIIVSIVAFQCLFLSRSTTTSTR